MMKNSSTDERSKLIQAIEELEKNPKDKVAFFTDIGAVGVGAVGFGAAASIFGGSTVSLAFGLVALPVAAPLTVVGGAALLGGAAMMGVKRFLIDGTAADERKRNLLDELKKRLETIEVKERMNGLDEADKLKFTIFLKEPLRQNLISPDEAKKYIVLVENGEVALSEAYALIFEILNDAKVPQKLLSGETST